MVNVMDLGLHLMIRESNQCLCNTVMVAVRCDCLGCFISRLAYNRGTQRLWPSYSRKACLRQQPPEIYEW